MSGKTDTNVETNVEEQAMQMIDGTTEITEEPVSEGFDSLTSAEIAEFTSLTDQGELQRAQAHRKKCKKNDTKPIAPSKWLVCPICGHRTPESLVNHFTRFHGGLNNVARQLGILPETIVTVNPELQQVFVEKGRNNAPKEMKQAS